MKVALVHDYLQNYGNAERVLEGLHHLYPDAPVYTAFVDAQSLAENRDRFMGWDLRPTMSRQWPGMSRAYPLYRRLMPYLWESLDLTEYDLVISSSGQFLCHGILTRTRTLHISYCHTPPRDLWEPIDPPQRRWPHYWWQTRLRQYDFYAAQRVDRFVTSSEIGRRRIRKFYRREAEVIAPPVRVRGEGRAGKDYYLYVGPLTRHQQVDLAIAACNRLHRPLWIAGTGPEADALRRLAGPTIRFLGVVPDAAIADLYAGAIALIYPTAHEEFGFAPVEAMGHGVPVIASQQSGMRQIVLDYRTGLLFEESTVAGLEGAIAKFENLRFSANACIERAEEFAESVFKSKFAWFVAKALDDHAASPLLGQESDDQP